MIARYSICWFVLGLMLPWRSQADPTVHLRTTRTDEYRVTYWTSEQGLPQNTVTCLLQSHDGYLWLGTRHGLVRYDGLHFTSYVTELVELDPDAADVRHLAQDISGRIWIDTSAGLICFQGGRFQLVSLEGTPFEGGIVCLCATSDGSVWVGRPKGIFELVDGKAARQFSTGFLLGKDFQGSRGDVQQILQDSHGRLWVLMVWLPGSQRSWQRVDPHTGQTESLTNLVHLAAPDIGGLAEDEGGKLWLERPGELLCWEGGHLSRFAPTNAWQQSLTSRVSVDRQGQVWLLTDWPSQLYRFANGSFTRLGTADGLRGADDLRCLLRDREGNVWIGSGGGGLNRIQPRQLVAVLSKTDSMPDEVYSVSPGRDGRVWLATGQGLVKYQEGRFTAYTNTVRLIPDGWVLKARPVLEARTGEVWMGLDGVGLATLQEGWCVPVETPRIAGTDKRRLYSLLEDHAGTLWICTSRGLLERRAGNYRLWTTNDGLSGNSVFGLAEGPDGSLWVGTAGTGVNRFKDGRFEMFTARDGLLSQQAWPLRIEPDGSAWIGTPVGLNRIRGKEVRTVTMRQGLFDNLAYCLLDDRHDNYWALCNRGIWRVNKTGLRSVADGTASHVFCVSYGEQDGMVSVEGNGDQQPNAAVLPNGELWFPTTRGVVIVDPEKLRDNKVRPQVVIEEVRVDEQPVFRDGGFAPAAASDARQARSATRQADSRSSPAPAQRPIIRLAPGRARFVEIRYTANTFIDPEKARFRYKLEGHDPGWREAGTRRTAFYTNLRPGNYRFRVEACNHHGYWSEKKADFEFSLAPHFYQTWPFLGLCAVGTASIGLGLHVRRIRERDRLHQLEQERVLQQERSRIAKDLHDDLGANLTGMALQVEVAGRELDQPATLRKHLQDMATSIRGLVDRMRDVVWTVNPECDTLESFCSHVGQYAENFLAAAGLRCRLDLPEDIPIETLSAEARHHLLLATKEALNNAAKYAGASEVRITIQLAGGWLVLSVADNGQGLRLLPTAAPDQNDAHVFNGQDVRPGPGRSGHGLENMRRRMESLGGELELRSEKGTGTQVTLRIPLTTS